MKELSMKKVLKRTPTILFQQKKKTATSSPASEQSGARVPKGRGGGDLPKISAFPANTPKFGGRGSSQGDKSPARAPHGLPVSQQTQVRDSRVLPKVVETVV